MDPTARKLAQLLESDDLGLRVAAVQVVSELGISSKKITEALAACLHEPHDELRIAALRGLARLGARDVAHAVVPLILGGGPLREQAMAVITAVGAPVVPQLKNLYAEADFHAKRAVISTMARIGAKAALEFLLKILPVEAFELQKHITLSLCEALDRMQPAQQSPIFLAVRRMMRSKDATRSPQLLVVGAILLGHFRGTSLIKKARDQLRLLAESKHAPEVRRHAVVSFNRLAADSRLTSPEEQCMFRLVCDPDWHNIAQHALAAVQRVKIPANSLSKLIKLLSDSPHFSVHIHVFERLRSTNRSDVAEAIIPFLSDQRFRVREAAEAALRSMPVAIESLFKVLVASDDIEVTQRVNSILRDFPQDTRKKFVERACARLLGLFDQNDPHFRSFLDFICSVDPEPLRRRVYEKAKKLKASRSRDKWQRMSSLLQLLWDNHLITAEGRYLLAVAQVRLSSKDLTPASRRANLGLQVIRSLVYDDARGLTRRLIADKDLQAEDYYYLGFHFSEEEEAMRDFGVGLLQTVVKKFRGSKIAVSANHKLQLQLRRMEERDAERAAERAEATRKASRKAAREAAPEPIRLKPGAGAAAKTARGAGAKTAKGEPKAPAKTARSPAAGPARGTKGGKARPTPAAKKKSATKKPAAKKKSAAKKKPATKKPAAKKKSATNKPAAKKKPARGKVGKSKKRPPRPRR